ncbi:MAG: restriction endonuclease [Alphaproteobacteria bacterium]|nr:restriction endonuclease [Alphaproteobacteria bacterium]
MKHGYEVKETPKTGDFGCDLIATKDELTFCIQCKNYNKPVGVSAVQQASSAQDYYECDFAVVASKSAFTNSALKMANKLNVICSSPTNLQNLISVCGDYV